MENLEEKWYVWKVKKTNYKNNTQNQGMNKMKYLHLFSIVLCCIIIVGWAVWITIKVDNLANSVQGLSNLLTDNIMSINKK